MKCIDFSLDKKEISSDFNLRMYSKMISLSYPKERALIALVLGRQAGARSRNLTRRICRTRGEGLGGGHPKNPGTKLVGARIRRGASPNRAEPPPAEKKQKGRPRRVFGLLRPIRT